MPTLAPATDTMSPAGFLDALVSVARDVSREQLRSRHLEGPALADAVRDLSESYTRERDFRSSRTTDDSALSARLQFFLPRDAPKVWGPLSELHWRGVLPHKKRYRILDVGAGAGATTLGTIAFLRAASLAAEFDVVALDRWRPGLEAMKRLTDERDRLDLGVIHLDCRHASFETLSAPMPGAADLVLFGFALNELGSDSASIESAHQAVRRSIAHLAPGGAVIVLEPALRQTARWLQALRDRAREDPDMVVFAPCTHREPCPLLTSPKDWCHEDQPGRLPDGIVDVARKAGLRYERLTYSYLTLRAPGHSVLQESENAARVVSQPLISKGKRELILCCDRGQIRATRLDRHATATNRAFTEAVRGDLIRLAVGETEGKLRVKAADAVQKLTSRRFPFSESTQAVDTDDPPT